MQSQKQPQKNIPVAFWNYLWHPGRATRLPEPGTLEYNQLVERMRNVVENNK
jgi:hypothetical protein